MMTRKEHLAWAKQRALEYVENNDLTNAYASMVSDISKHTELEGHPAIMLGMMEMANSGLNTKDSMRHFIEGFN
jgi:hypothetical protein